MPVKAAGSRAKGSSSAKAFDSFQREIDLSGGIVAENTSKNLSQLLKNWSEDHLITGFPALPEPRACLFQDTFKQIERDTRESSQLMLQRIQEQYKTHLFRTRFSDKLVVTCYGRVGTGKSTLGNYIGAGLKASFYELNGSEETPIEAFVSDFLPVSGLRLFKTDKMVWVDSPGRFSRQSKGDDADALEARKWADVLLFLSPFRQAFTESEEKDFNKDTAKVMEEYSRQGIGVPPVFVVLSMADQPDYQKSSDPESGSIPVKPYSAEDKKSLEKYLRARFEGNSLAREILEYIPVSTHLAEQGQFEDSGMPELLNRIIAKYRDGQATIKAERARQHTVSLIGELAGIIEEHKNKVERLRAGAVKAREGATRDLEQLIGRIKTAIRDTGNNILREAAGQKDSVKTEGDIQMMDRAAREELMEKGWRAVAPIIEEFARKHFAEIRLPLSEIRSNLKNDTPMIDVGSIMIRGGKKDNDSIIPRMQPTHRTVEKTAESVARSARQEIQAMIKDIEDKMNKFAEACVDWHQKHLEVLQEQLENCDRKAYQRAF